MNATPAVYSRKETARIRKMVFKPGVWVTCPRCNGNLTLGPPIAHGGSTVWELRCSTCWRSVMIREFPAAVRFPPSPASPLLCVMFDRASLHEENHVLGDVRRKVPDQLEVPTHDGELR